MILRETLSATRNFRGMNYSYDANGRMTSAVRTDNTASKPLSMTAPASGCKQSPAASRARWSMTSLARMVADYANGSLERENIYRGGQLLATSETLNAAAPATLTTTSSLCTSFDQELTLTSLL
jgi:YD repeat-containing protein